MYVTVWARETRGERERERERGGGGPETVAKERARMEYDGRRRRRKDAHVGGGFQGWCRGEHVPSP